MNDLHEPCIFCEKLIWCGEAFCKPDYLEVGDDGGEARQLRGRDREGGSHGEGADSEGGGGQVSVLQSVAFADGVLSGSGPKESELQDGGIEAGRRGGAYSRYKDARKRRGYMREYMRAYRERKKGK